LRILGKQTQKQGERKTQVMREGALKKPACPQPIVQAVSAFIYEHGYPIGYLTSHDP